MTREIDFFELLTVSEKLEPVETVLPKTYPSRNSGFFIDVSLSQREQDPYALSSAGIYIINRAQEALCTNGKCRLAGIGEMIGYDFILIGTKFQREISNGQMEIAVTNLEEFDAASALDTARTRLELFGSMDHYLDLYNSALYYSPDILRQLQKYRPILATLEQISFVEENKHLVKYISGVSSDNLNEYFDGESIDIIHENYGGLFHYPSPNLTRPLASIGSVLRENGLLITSTNLHNNASDSRALSQFSLHHWLENTYNFDSYNIYKRESTLK